MTKLLSILILLLLITSATLKAQNSEAEIRTEFFRIFKSDPIKAMDYAFSTNVWMERNVDAVENLKNQFSNLLPLIGTYYGHEVITEKNIGNNYKLISYIVRYDRQPLRFIFIMYKPNDAWQVQNLKYDDNLDEEIVEAASQSRN